MGINLVVIQTSSQCLLNCLNIPSLLSKFTVHTSTKGRCCE